MKIYVASSWRNPLQPSIVKLLRSRGHEVYDFREPAPGETGFSWAEIDRDWQKWTPAQYRTGLRHGLAELGYARDMHALEEADVCVMVQPCGVSAALELGWAVGHGIAAAVLLNGGERFEPELMLGMADKLCVSTEELLAWLSYVEVGA